MKMAHPELSTIDDDPGGLLEFIERQQPDVDKAILNEVHTVEGSRYNLNTALIGMIREKVHSALVPAEINAVTHTHTHLNVSTGS